jgi:hypothetical protein
MKQSINESEFVNQIVQDEYNAMSYRGARALFNWLEELEANTGEEIEFDKVAIRCEFSEYDNIEAVMDDYDSIRSLSDLQDNTCVIEVPDTNRLIIQQF